MTNATRLPDGSELSRTLWKLNAQVVPVYRVPTPENCQFNRTWQIAYWKLQIWRLTQFEKLIWLDTDAILFRSIDWLFERRPVWGQMDNQQCDGSSDRLSSGILLIEPGEATYKGLLEHANRTHREWSSDGDQGLIRHYFKHINQPVQLLEASDAAFGMCLGHTPGLPYNSPSQWNIPAFVHRSSVNNECFYIDVAKQMVNVKGTVVNVCHFHPLGQYWRDLFCDAVNIIDAMPMAGVVANFCDDFLWHGGEWAGGTSGRPQPHSP
jgi:hypothetical protein